MGEVEVSFDYPEEDIEYATSKIIKHRLSVLNNKIASLINSSKTGSLIKNGINAVIIGRPNVGKSSLLNALLNKEKAIVTNIAGTTRDVIEDAFEINGVKVNIIDTAGIHETKDKIEKIGVNKSIEYIKKAAALGIKQAPTLIVVKDGAFEKYVGLSDIKKFLNN